MPERSPSKSILGAVIEADPEKLVHSVGLSPGTSPHLISAGGTLMRLAQTALSENPSSELARQLVDMLHRESLFEVIGKWPPDGTAPGKSGGSPQASRPCRHCGGIDP